MASDFKLSDCIRAPKNQLCWDCVKACGGCSWSGIDPKTHKPRFEPIPGWDAKPKTVEIYGGKGKPHRVITSYAIRYCPEFVQEERHG